MKPNFIVAAAALMLLVILIGGASGPTSPALSDKARLLFRWQTLDGWESPDKQLWAVNDGCLTGDGINKIPYNGFLCTKASYSNFILHLKIKLTGDPKTSFINSGIQIRTKRNPTGHKVCGYQCDYGEPAWYAAIYNEGRRNRLMMKSDMAALHPVIHLDEHVLYLHNRIAAAKNLDADHAIAGDVRVLLLVIHAQNAIDPGRDAPAIRLDHVVVPVP
jgi:hypothetical protein